MTGFSLHRRIEEDHQTLEISHHDAGVHVEISLLGATLLRWVLTLAEGQVDLVDGYASRTELAEQDGVRNGIMAPFSNRVAQARYELGGIAHDLLPGSPEEQRLIYHGFVRTAPFDVLDTEVTTDCARVLLRTTAIRPHHFAGYPFSVDVTVEYTVTLHGVDVTIYGENVGTSPAPYTSGWHPYFRLDTKGIDHLDLHVPAQAVIATDELLVPLPGRSAVVRLPASPPPPQPTPGPLAGLVLDTCYADLVPGADGLVRTVLHDPASGRRLTVWQERGLMHVFTGDTLARDRRASVALEPVELPTDAFNRPEDAAALLLPPGGTRRFAFGVSLDS